jgi:dinuclear metal center YbgI/SA1388 family protein
MLIKDIYKFLDELSPFELQEKWDNSGLLVGNMDNDIKKIYISIDLDLEILEEIEENSLIITHHPLIFKPLKNLVPDSFSTILALELIKKNISLISMHTNFDKTHLNKFVAKKIFNSNIENEDFICYIDVDDNFKNILNLVEEKLETKHLNYVKTKENIKKIALTTGAGMSLLPFIDADLFLTGDIKYHEAMEAKIKNISLIDITHYESEKYFSNALYNELREFKQYAIILNSKNPFKRSQ